MKHIALLLAFAICMEQSITAQTNVSGYILTNTTWTQAGSPYIVTGNALVVNGVTLTIEPGVTVQFDSTRALQIDGELIAIGTASDRITFTASSPTPTKGSWGRIQFKNSSTDAAYNTNGGYVSGSILKFCDIMYGGGVGNTAVVDCDTSSPHISHCRISYSKTGGIYFNRSANGGIDSSSIKYCDGMAMYYYYTTATDLHIQNDTIEYTKGIQANSGLTYSGGSIDYNYTFNNAYFYNNVFISNSDRAIFLALKSCEIIGNQFISNTANSNSYSNIDGLVYVSKTNYCLVSNNEFNSNNVSASYNSVGSLLHLSAYYNGTIIISENVFLSNSIPLNIGYSGESYILRTSNADIVNNHFEDNDNVMQVANCHVQCNTFLQNRSINGEDVCSGSSFVVHNLFEGNIADSSTSVWRAGYYSEFANNLFKNNSAPDGSIISFQNYNSGFNIHNNDFVGNTGLNCLGISESAIITGNNFLNPGIQYEISNSRLWGTPNIQADNNYWGTSNTAHIDSVIRDFFDDAAYSVVYYVPILTSPALVDTSCPVVICSLSVAGSVVSPSCYGGSNGSVNITVSNGTAPITYAWSTGASSEDISNQTSGSYTVTVIDANLCSATKSFTLTQPSSVTVVSGVVTNANCNSGGAINIAASGGTSPYTYNWGSGITIEDRTGLNPGNNAVTVRDNYNCSATQSFTVGQDAGPVISGTTTNTSCNNSCDGAIDVSVSGVAPFTYDWGTGFGASEDTSGLCAGIYNITVADSNNCGIATSFNITSPSAIVASASVATDVSCFGFSDGAATAAATGGTMPYSFLWSDGQTAATATGFSAGAYDVTVTDSLGCTALASVTMPDGYNVDAGVIIGFTTAGINQPTLYSVNANSGYTFNWSITNGIITSGQGTNGIEVVWTSAGAGLVELIASEQGCADTVSKSVTVVDTAQNCSAQFYLYPDTVPHSYFVVNTASGIPQLSYSWNWGDGSANDTIAYPSHTYNAAGFYTICLTITDSAGCTDTYCNPYFLLKAEDESSAMIEVNVYPPTFTTAHSAALENILLYPNPTNGIVVLRTSETIENATLKLFDLLGAQLLEQTVAGSQLRNGVEIDLKDASEGIFFISISTAEESRMLKVVKY